MPAYSTFPLAEYHRAEMISLLCSEWEEVGHISVKHGQAKISMRDSKFLFGINIHRLITRFLPPTLSCWLSVVSCCIGLLDDWLIFTVY
jgi:hypothetical protein